MSAFAWLPSRKAGLLFCLLWAGLSMFHPPPAEALSGQWVDLPHGKARLMVSGEPLEGELLAGLEIRLDEGWKTYWRFPGDSGLAPHLDWSRSQNVKEVQLLFPAPRRFRDAYGQTIGYQSRVLFPIRLKLKNAGQATVLDLVFELGICADICIPVERRFVLKAPPLFVQDKAIIATLEQALSTVPKPAPESAKARFHITKTNGEALLLVIKTPGKEALALEDIFVEGPQNWFLSLPERISENVETTTWHLPLRGIPAGIEPWGSALRLTLVGRQAAYSQDLALDKSLLRP